MDYLDRFVPDVTFEKIPIRNLVSSQEYQRSLSHAHIEKAAENFDVFQINPVKVSRRDGINYVFNGQHTIEIVAAVSGSRETPVWCMVYDALTYSHEADIFANQMKFVKPLKPYEVFMANVEAKNHTQLMILDLVHSYGLEIGNKRAPNVICAISSLEGINRDYGINTLSRVLRLVIGAWEGDMNSFSANILNAVAKLVVVYKDQLNEDVFAEKLGAISVKALTRIAKERRAGSMGFAEAMIIEYNGKKKNQAFRLNIRQLYDKDVALWARSEDDEFDDTETFEKLFAKESADDDTDPDDISIRLDLDIDDNDDDDDDLEEEESET